MWLHTYRNVYVSSNNAIHTLHIQIAYWLANNVVLVMTYFIAAAILVSSRALGRYTNCADGTYACMYDLQKALDTVECGIILKQNSIGRHED